MDETGGEPALSQARLGYPSWISIIEDQQARNDAQRLYLEKEELERRQDSNLKFISSLRSQCTVQQERIGRLERKRTIAIAAIGGGLGVVGLAALLIANFPTFGIPAAVFLTVLLARACYPALLEILKASAKKRSADRY